MAHTISEHFDAYYRKLSEALKQVDYKNFMHANLDSKDKGICKYCKYFEEQHVRGIQWNPSEYIYDCNNTNINIGTMFFYDTDTEEYECPGFAESSYWDIRSKEDKLEYDAQNNWRK